MTIEKRKKKTNWILGQSRKKTIEFNFYCTMLFDLFKHVEMILWCNSLYDTVSTAKTKARLIKFLKFHFISVCFIFIHSSNNTIITYADRLVASRFQYISSLWSTFASHYYTWRDNEFVFAIMTSVADRCCMVIKLGRRPVCDFVLLFDVFAVLS